MVGRAGGALDCLLVLAARGLFLALVFGERQVGLERLVNFGGARGDW